MLESNSCCRSCLHLLLSGILVVPIIIMICRVLRSLISESYYLLNEESFSIKIKILPEHFESLSVKSSRSGSLIPAQKDLGGAFAVLICLSLARLVTLSWVW